MTVYRFCLLIFQWLHIFTHLLIFSTINFFKIWDPIDVTNLNEHVSPYQSLLHPYALHFCVPFSISNFSDLFFCWLVGAPCHLHLPGSMSCSGLGWWSWCLEPSEHLGLRPRRRSRTPNTAGGRGARAVQRRSGGAQLCTTAVCAQSSRYFGYAGIVGKGLVGGRWIYCELFNWNQD